MPTDYRLRGHQQRFYDLIERTVASWPSDRWPGGQPRRVLAHVRPGGGKSAYPVIAAKLMIPTVGDKIVWVTPRILLESQAAESFAPQSFLRKVIQHKNEIVSRGDGSFLRADLGKAGFSTTYQAIIADARKDVPLLPKYFKDYRVILVMDEPHHVPAPDSFQPTAYDDIVDDSAEEAEGKAFYEAMKPLDDLAVFTILMTGTLGRHDRKKVGFLPYKEGLRDERRRRTFTVDTDAIPTIQATRTELLAEQSVVPMNIIMGDGEAEYIDRNGDRQQVESIALAHGKSAKEALYVGLRTDYAFQILGDCTSHWLSYRGAHPWSKMIVVAPSQKMAKDYEKRLQQRSGIRTALAISDEGPAAKAAISRFRKDNAEHDACDVLVTCQMAYEGLDVPAATHLACLTHIRSLPMIEQTINRVSRPFNTEQVPYDEQECFVFAPKDEFFVDIKEQIRLEEDEAAVLSERQGPGGGGGDFEPIVEISSRRTSTNLEQLDGIERMTEQEIEFFTPFSNKFGVTVVKTREMYIAMTGKDPFAGRSPRDAHEVLGASADVRIQKLRNNLNARKTSMDASLGLSFGTVAYLTKTVHNRSVEPKDMTEEELIAEWTWLNTPDTQEWFMTNHGRKGA